MLARIKTSVRLRAKPVDRGGLDALVSFAVRHAFADVSAAFNAGRRGDAITIHRYSVMALVAQNGGITLSAIAGAVGVAAPRASIVMGELAALGWVEKRPIEGHARFDGHHLTDEGRAEFELLQSWMGELDARLTARLSAAERATLLELLAKVVG